MGRVTELTVTKGKTVKAGENDEWTRVEYSVKAAITDDSELQIVKAQIEGTIDRWLTGSAKPTSTAQPANIFPKTLADMLTFEENKDWVIVKPKSFLGSENFSRIAAIVRDNKGEYISAGKESHFRLPKIKQT